MTGYMLLYVTYMYHFVCLVSLLYAWLHSYMLGYMYHSCKLGFKYYSLMLDYMHLRVCVVDCALPMHVDVCMWPCVQWCNGFCCHA